MIAQTNHQLSQYAAENKVDTVICYEWGKPPKQKPHWVILRSSFPRINYYHNKWLQVKWSQYLIPTYSWTLTSISNWTCSVVTISTWLTNQCTDPRTWLTTNLRRMLVEKFFSSSTRWRSWNSLVMKPYDIQMQQLLQEKDELGHMSLVTIWLWKTFALSCISCDGF